MTFTRMCLSRTVGLVEVGNYTIRILSYKVGAMQSDIPTEKQTTISPIASSIPGQPMGDAMGDVVAGGSRTAPQRIAPTVTACVSRMSPPAMLESRL